MSHKRNAILRRLCWGDWVVAAGLSLLVAVTAYAQIAPGRRGSMAMIHAPGMADRTISLQEDQSIEVQGKLGISRIEVKGGRVRMIEIRVSQPALSSDRLGGQARPIGDLPSQSGLADDRRRAGRRPGRGDEIGRREWGMGNAPTVGLRVPLGIPSIAIRTSNRVFPLPSKKHTM
jgi:hypothetical protein